MFPATKSSVVQVSRVPQLMILILLTSDCREEEIGRKYLDLSGAEADLGKVSLRRENDRDDERV